MSGQTGQVLGASTVTTTGAIILPHTAGNTLGTILAYTAIGVGVVALSSQFAVRVLRKIYR